MNRLILGVLATAIVASPASAQDWERIFGTDSAPPADFSVLMLNPGVGRDSPDRYKIVSLADLVAPFYTFPDSLTRYVAVKTGSHRPTFTAADMRAGNTSPALLKSARIPRPSQASGWVAVAVPLNRPLTYAAMGDRTVRHDRTGDFVRQAGTITLGGTAYTVWVADVTFSGATPNRSLYFSGMSNR